MTSQSPVICAYRLAKDIKDAALDEQGAIDNLRASRLVWAHLDATHPETGKWLLDHVPNMDGLIADALLARETRPRMTEFRNGTMIFLRGVNLNENADAEDMVSIRIWIDEWRIITLRLRKLKAVQDIKDRFAEGRGPANAAEFLTALTSRLFERMDPVIQDLDDATDDVEEMILDTISTQCRQKVVDIRKKAIILRRYISPQKEAIAALRRSELPWLDQTNRRHLQEGLDKLTRYVEDLDAIRERAQVVKEEITNMLSDRMNRNMYALSIIAGIFLPLGFLTGLLGINVGGMPGVDSDIAFWIVCLLCLGLLGITLGLFKTLRWFDDE